jgi:hypothetical protein
LEHSLCKTHWTCRRTDYAVVVVVVMMVIRYICIYVSLVHSFVFRSFVDSCHGNHCW